MPEKDAEKEHLVRFPDQKTIDIIFDETATFTCNLIFRMLYNYVGTIEPWFKYSRPGLSTKKLLVIGTGNIGGRVAKYMHPFMQVSTFDILENNISDLELLIKKQIVSRCISQKVMKTMHL